jgi:hypothetical protein
MIVGGVSKHETSKKLSSVRTASGVDLETTPLAIIKKDWNYFVIPKIFIHWCKLTQSVDSFKRFVFAAFCFCKVSKRRQTFRNTIAATLPRK